MKTKTKSKRGKAIMGIAMAAIMLASVFAAMVPTGMARETLGNITDGDTLFTNEHGLATDLDAFNLKKVVDDNVVETISIPNASNFYIPIGAETGGYEVRDGSDNRIANLTIKEPKITGNVYIYDLEGDKTTLDSVVGKTIPVGTGIWIRAGPNFGGLMNASYESGYSGNWGKVKVKLIDPDGLEIVKPKAADASEIEITPRDWLVLENDPDNDTALDAGTWTVKIVSDKDTCNEVDVSSPAYEFTVRSEELDITAEKDDVGKGDDILLTVSAQPSRYYYFAIENVVDNEEPEIQDTFDVVRLGNGEGTTKYTAAWIKTGSDGIADIKISTTAADERTYIMNVYYDFDADDRFGNTWPESDTECVVDTDKKFYTPADVEEKDPEPKDDDDVKVKVREAKVTFDIPTTAIVGEDVVIKGTITAGDKVDILIEDGKLSDDRWDDETVDENGEFEVKWDTAEKMTGTYSIDVYIDEKEDAVANPATVAALDEDGRTTIRLVEPGLTSEPLRNVVAENDDYTIEGTATGVDTVDIVLIGPKGFMADAYSVIDGLLITSTSVTDNEFSEDIRMEDGLDTGQWIALVLFPGRDGKYGTGEDGITAGNLADDDDIRTLLKGKTRDQIMAILEDFTIEQAGSDDDLVMFTFKVESGYIDLNPVETVAIGEPLNLTGVTNREPETVITISTFAKPAGATDLPAVLAEVEWSTKDEGVFSGTIDTTDAVPGTYTLEADDGDGNTDTITVELVEEIVPIATPTPEPTVKPTEAPVPTPEATATPEPTPTPTPGFEAVFAIAGLLSIAYLVLRRRK